MFNTKTIILAKALRPDLNFASPGAEELVWLKIASRYASGNPVRNATISNGIAYFDRVTVSQPLVSLKLNIPVTQSGSGTPSPDNIRDIVGVQGVTISRTGKNLFNSSLVNPIVYNAQGDKRSGIIIKQAGTYTINAHNADILGYCFVKVVDGNGNYGTSSYVKSGNTLTAVTLTVPINGKLLVYTEVPQSAASDFFDNIEIQIELGSEATPYEPYTGNTYQITFGQTVYSAILDVLTGELSITHEIVDLGDLTWTKNDTTYSFTYFLGSTVSGMKIGLFDDKYACSAYPIHDGGRASLPDEHIGSYSSGQARPVVRDDSKSNLTAEEFKSAMSGVYFAYELAEPIEIQLTPTVINTLIGENVIFADVADVTECKFTRK